MWALSPLCSGGVKNFKAKKITSKKKEEGEKKTATAAAGNGVLVWAVADLHVSQQDKLQHLSEMQQLKGEKMMGTCFLLPPASADTHLWKDTSS